MSEDDTVKVELTKDMELLLVLVGTPVVEFPTAVLDTLPQSDVLNQYGMEKEIPGVVVVDHVVEFPGGVT